MSAAHSTQVAALLLERLVDQQIVSVDCSSSPPPQVDLIMPHSSKSVPIPIHRSASHTPSMMVNAKKYLSDRPQLLDCPRCKSHGETELHFVNGFFTYVAFLVILIAGIFVLPLFFLWVPFCVETFKDVEHHCPSCKAWIGTYRRLGKST